MRRAVLLALLLLSVPLSCLGAEPGGSVWPTYHGDASLSGASSVALPEAPVRLWRFDAGSAVAAAPVAGGGRIYFHNDKGTVFAVDLAGKKVWSREIDRDAENGGAAVETFFASPTYVDGTLLLGSDEGTVCALDAADGSTRWSRKLGRTIQGAITWAERGDGRIAIAVTQPDGILHAFDLAGGQAAWTGERTARTDGSAAVAEGRLVYANCERAFYVFDVATGKRLTQVGLGEGCEMAAGVAIRDGLAFAGTRGGEVACVDMHAGELKWRTKLSEDEVFTTPAVTADRVVIGGDDGNVHCLERGTGKVAWTAETRRRPSSPVIAGDRVVVSSGGEIALLRLENGERRWAKRVGDEISSPALIGGIIVVGTDDGVVALGEEAREAGRRRQDAG